MNADVQPSGGHEETEINAGSNAPLAASQELAVIAVPPPPRRVSAVKARRLASLHETAAVGLALGALAVGYMAWRLSEGTISIAVAKPVVEDALEKLIGGQAQIGELRLGWDKTRRDFVVTANQISATTDARTSPLALGQVSLTLNARALLSGHAQITRAQLAGMQAVLVLDKQGRTAFGFGTPDEVLRLPRLKRQTTGLRATLDLIRKAVLPQSGSGRLELIALTNAQLVVIDPDTKERLTLGDARATVTTDANNILTVQAAGYPRELGGFANFAISASPDPRQHLVLATVFERARLAGLPSSLRVGPLSRIRMDTAPLSGNVLVYLNDGNAASQVQANVTLGAGRFQGLNLRAASGNFDWNSVTGDLKFQNAALDGAGVSVAQVSGSLSALKNGVRTLLLDAKRFAVSHPSLGAIGGELVRARAILRLDNTPMSATISGQSLRVARPALGNLQANDVALVITTPNNRQPNFVSAKLDAQTVSGVFQGRTVTGSAIEATLQGERQGTSFRPTKLSTVAQKLAGSLDLNNVTQSFDIKNLNLIADSFASSASGTPQMPNTLAFSAQDLRLGNDVNSLASGQMSAVSLDATGIWNGRLQAQGTIGDLNASARGVEATGKSIAFALNQTGAASALLSNFTARNFGLNARQATIGATGLSARGNLDRSGLSNAQVSSDSVEVIQPDQLTRPFWADDLAIQGRIGPDLIALDSFSLRHRGLSIDGNTAIERKGPGLPSVALTADIDGRFSVQTLLAAWPRRLLPETRSAIARLIPAGSAQVSRLNLALPAGRLPKQIMPSSAVDLDFSVADVAITYLPGMSPITGVNGQGILTGSSLSMDLPSGSIGNLALTQAKLDIPQFAPKGAQVLIAANVAGDVTEMAHEIDLPPLAILSKAKITPDRLTGFGQASVKLDFALKPALMPRDIGVQVSGDFEDAGLTRTFAGLDATNGKVHLEVVNARTTVSGQATLADNLFDFTWASSGGDTLQPHTSLTADGDVSIASLRALGLDITPYASGPIRIGVQSNTEGTEFGAAILNADFINTNITLPGNVWIKPEGVSGRASANLFPREGGGWNVQDLRFNSGATSLKGALDLSDDAKLVDARFSRVVIPDAMDLSVDVTPGLNGLTVTLRGDYLNLSPYLKTQNVSEKAVDLLDRPLTLSADINRVLTGEDSVLNNVHADIVRDNQGWRNFAATGESAAGKSQIRLMVERDGRRSISGVLSDAGFFAQLLYPGAPIFGGTGVIEGELPVVGANSLGSLTFTGKDIWFARTGSSPILFANVRLPMNVAGGIVTLRDGQADGDAYTVKASGYVDVGAGRLDLRGVATPGGLNRVLADIPLFGAILGGGADEGLLGITFAANGRLSAPRLRTNPISALAPGFLRKLFESEAPISPQPMFIVTTFAGDPVATKWPYGPTEDMSETPTFATNEAPSGPAQ